MSGMGGWLPLLTAPVLGRWISSGEDHLTLPLLTATSHMIAFQHKLPMRLFIAFTIQPEAPPLVVCAASSYHHSPELKREDDGHAVVKNAVQHLKMEVCSGVK